MVKAVCGELLALINASDCPRCTVINAQGPETVR